MATRTQKVHECDRAGCRRRKDVQYYEVTMLDAVSNEMAGNQGELCPAHRKMAANFINNLFKNTKDYDEPAED